MFTLVNNLQRARMNGMICFVKLKRKKKKDEVLMPGEINLGEERGMDL